MGMHAQLGWGSVSYLYGNCKVKVTIVLGEPDATYSDLKHTGLRAQESHQWAGAGAWLHNNTKEV